MAASDHGASSGPGARLVPMPRLDGLRGWAVAAVVAYHLRLVPGGFLGVDVFFVLSGFLVTSLLLIEADGTGGVSLGRFWTRRLRRLAPAVMVLVPAVLVAAMATGWPRTRWDDVALDGAATLTWWANWRQIGGGTSYWAPDPSPFRHAWSLSIEEQFYLLWPLALVVVVAWTARRTLVRRPVGAVAALGAVAGFGWLLLVAHRTDDLSRAYLGTDTRIATPLVGCALACWWTEDRRAAPPRLAAAGTPIGLGVLVVMVATVDVDAPSTYRWGLIPLAAIAAAVLLVGLTAGGGRAPDRGLGGDPVSRYLGTRSYGIYLWSWPIQVLVEHRWPDLSRAATIGIVLAASLTVAEGSHRWVEQPVRRGVGWARPARIRRVATAVAAVVALGAVVAVSRGAEPPPVHERLDADEVAADAATRPPPTTAPMPGPGVGEGEGEERGLRVMVVGDSVAFTLAYHAAPEDLPPGIESLDGRGLLGCAVLASAGWTYPDPRTGEFTADRGGGACARQAEAERAGLGGRPDVVLVPPGAWEYSAARSPDGHTVAARSAEMGEVLVDALLERARAADAVGAAFAMVEWACPGPESSAERRDPDYARWLSDVLHDAASRGRAEGLRTTVIEVTEAVCAGGDPAGEPTDEWLAAVRHENHVGDREGARWVWTEWLGPGLADWLGSG